MKENIEKSLSIYSKEISYEERGKFDAKPTKKTFLVHNAYSKQGERLIVKFRKTCGNLVPVEQGYHKITFMLEDSSLQSEKVFDRDHNPITDKDGNQIIQKTLWIHKLISCVEDTEAIEEQREKALARIDDLI